MTEFSAADRHDLERYFKYMALKATQIICQARLGEKMHTPCVPNENGRRYWFNLAINDHPEVLAEARQTLGAIADKSILPNLPFCVEIRLKTEDHDMLLEVWTLSLVNDPGVPVLSTLHGCYVAFCSLLKSIIVVSRATPAYRLARRQKQDTYKIRYSLSLGKAPDIPSLGDALKNIRIGQISTVLGVINMSVAYRTKMTISPTPTGRDNTIMLKSDHFLNDVSPKHIRYHNTRKNEKKVIDLDKPMQPGAFADLTKIKQYTEEDYILPETPPFSWLLKKTQKEGDEASSPVEDIMMVNPPKSPASFNNNNSSLPLLQKYDGTMDGINKLETDSQASSPKSLSDSRKFNRLVSKEDERLLLKELYFPFATEVTPIYGLAKFYRDCFNAPPLQHIPDSIYDQQNETANATSDVLNDDEHICGSTHSDDIDDLTQQLERFETTLGDFDSLVTSLCCQSEVDSNSNS